MVGNAISTPSIAVIAAAMLSALVMVFPWAALTTSCGSSFDNLSPISPEKPLNTDNTHTMAAVVTITPHTATIDMMLTALWVFFDFR